MLYHTAGKAQAPQAWAGEMRTALGGLGGAMGVLAGEGWTEGELCAGLGGALLMRADPFRVQPPPPPANLPGLPADPVLRIQAALLHLEGWTELVLALLRSVPCLSTIPSP